jgi:predicted ester cyclase
MSVEANKAIVARFIQDVWAEGRLSVVDELVAQDHVHHLTTRDAHGPDGVKKLVSWFRSFLPDVQIGIRELIAEGDRVVVYFSFSGTDTGGYRDNPPSGNPVEYSGIDIFRLSGGRIVERWGIVDTISMLRQIGATLQ